MSAKTISSWTGDVLEDGFQRTSATSLASKTTIRKRHFSSSTVYSSACYKDFKILHYILQLIGIEMFEDRKDSPIRVSKFTLFSLLCCLYYFGLLGMSSYVAITEGITLPAMRFANTLTYNLLGILQFQWVYLALFRQQKTFQDLFDHLSAISNDVLEDNSKVHRKIRRLAVLGVIIIGLLVIGHMLFAWNFLAVVDNSFLNFGWSSLGVSHSVWIACSANSTMMCFTNLHLAALYSVNYLVRLPIHAFFVLLSVFLAYTISSHFKGLQHRYGLESCKDLASSRRVHDLIRRHHSLAKIVKLYDVIFQQPLVIWSLEEFVSLIFIVRLLNLHKGMSAIHPSDVMVIVSSISLFILKLAFVAYMNSQVTSSLQGLTVIAEIDNLDTNGLPTSLESHETKQNQKSIINSQIELYIRHITIQPPSASGMGLFSIYSGVLLTACGQSLTYILALYGIPE